MVGRRMGGESGVARRGGLVGPVMREYNQPIQRDTARYVTAWTVHSFFGVRARVRACVRACVCVCV